MGEREDNFMYRAAEIILLVALASTASFAADPPKPKITVSKETTYITEPLRADGVPDYVGALNEPLKAIKPEDNAAVLLVQAIGRDAVSDKIAVEFHRLLQSPRPPEKGDFLIQFPAFLKDKGLEDDEKAMEAFDAGFLKPWKSTELPLIAEYVRANEAPLRLAVEATKRKRCVAPFVSPDDPPMIAIVQLDMVQSCRMLQKLLILRAMNHAGEGRLDAAFDDLDALHRLAALIGADARSIIELMVSIFFRNAALRAEQKLAFTPGVNEATLRQRANAAASLPPPKSVIDCFDHEERLSLLNMTLYSMVYGAKVLDKNAKASAVSFDAVAIDEAMRTMNGFIDRYVKAMRAKPEGGGETIGQIEDELSAKAKAARERKDTFFLFRPTLPPHPRGPKAAAGQAYAETMTSMLLPAMGMAANAEVRTKAVERQTALAFAFAAFKKRHGKYPDSLDAAELELPADAVVDPFTGKPFVYELKDGKRRIVSAEPQPAGFRITVAGKPSPPPEHILELP
jgi:hypothetical protein